MLSAQHSTTHSLEGSLLLIFTGMTQNNLKWQMNNAKQRQAGSTSTVENRFIWLLFPTVANDWTTILFIPGLSFVSNNGALLIEYFTVTFGFGFTAIELTTCFCYRPFSSLAHPQDEDNLTNHQSHALRWANGGKLVIHSICHNPGLPHWVDTTYP